MPRLGSQYASDGNLAARQRLWDISERVPAFDFYGWVLDVAAVEGGERVAEVGCGNGAYLELLSTAVGLDISVGMLSAARARVGNPLVGADAAMLPFRDGAFDVVLAPHMLYHVLDRVSAAGELRRVVASGGRCVAVTNSESNHRELVRLVEGVVGHGWTWRGPVDTFSMENGKQQLREGFSQVQQVHAPDSVFLVRDANALADYVASVADVYEQQVCEWMPWSEVVARCRVAAREVIDRDGAFPISTVFGAFVCR